VTAIRKHLVDFAAIVALIVVAFAVASVILAHQRLALPAWVPFVGEDFVEVDAELSSAQAVTPGQGQTVNVAGVEVGEMSRVRLEDGKAIVTLKLRQGAVPVYKDATVLLRPKTGLKDMVAELTPGTPEAGELPEGARIPIGQTLPDVNVDEILASLDGDTRAFLVLLLSGGAEGLRGNAKPLADAIRRFEPLARDTRAVSSQLARREANIRRVVHNFSLLVEELGGKDDQLAEFVENSNAVFSVFAAQDASLRATLAELPSTLTETQSALAKTGRLARVLGPALTDLLPTARALGPTLQQVQPFLRDTTPVIQDEIRPFVRAARPNVTQLQPALNDLSAVAPDLVTSFQILNALVNTLAYNPPGARDEGFLFWASWLNHLGPTLFATQDAHGPLRRGLVLISCTSLALLDNVIRQNPQLGVLTQLLDTPPRSQVCPGQAQAPTTPAAG
jgi:phospholipid/cholesterol/gamma-HCH transport system substrate-binding protein